MDLVSDMAGRTDLKARVHHIERTGFIPVKRWMDEDTIGRIILRKFDIEVKKDAETGCWHWPLTVSSNGYGKFYWEGAVKCAHRWLLEQVRGRKIKRKYDVDHAYWTGCRYRDCVRPSHLEPVTRAENIRRGNWIKKQVEDGVWCPEGHPYNNDNTRYEYDPVVGKSFRECKTCNPIAPRKKSVKKSIRRNYVKAA